MDAISSEFNSLERLQDSQAAVAEQRERVGSRSPPERICRFRTRQY